MRDRGSKGSASSCRTSSMASSCRSTPTAAGSMVSATLWWKSTAKVLKSMQQQAVKERYHFIAFFWAQVVLVSNSHMSCVFSIRLLQTFFFACMPWVPLSGSSMWQIAFNFRFHLIFFLQARSSCTRTIWVASVCWMQPIARNVSSCPMWHL